MLQVQCRESHIGISIVKLRKKYTGGLSTSKTDTTHLPTYKTNRFYPTWRLSQHGTHTSGYHVDRPASPFLSFPPLSHTHTLFSLDWAGRPAVGRRSLGQGGPTAGRRRGGGDTGEGEGGGRARRHRRASTVAERRRWLRRGRGGCRRPRSGSRRRWRGRAWRQRKAMVTDATCANTLAAAQHGKELPGAARSTMAAAHSDVSVRHGNGKFPVGDYTTRPASADENFPHHHQREMQRDNIFHHHLLRAGNLSPWSLHPHPREPSSSASSVPPRDRDERRRDLAA